MGSIGKIDNDTLITNNTSITANVASTAELQNGTSDKLVSVKNLVASDILNITNRSMAQASKSNILLYSVTSSYKTITRYVNTFTPTQDGWCVFSLNIWGTNVDMFQGIPCQIAPSKYFNTSTFKFEDNPYGMSVVGDTASGIRFKYPVSKDIEYTYIIGRYTHGCNFSTYTYIALYGVE